MASALLRPGPSFLSSARLRRRLVAVVLGVLVVGTGILIAAQAIMPALPPLPGRSTPTASEPSAPIASPRPTQVLQPPITLKIRTTSVEAPEGLGQPGTFKPPLRLSPPYGIVDSVHIEQNGKTVRLAFVEGLARDAVCKDSRGLRYACGLRGRASLAKLTAGQPLLCWPVFSQGNWNDDLPYQCFVDGRDLGRGQAEAGFAEPALPSAAPYAVKEAAENQAFVSEAPDIGPDE
jgi:endonuclease YncB( thermonuclease family)